MKLYIKQEPWSFKPRFHVYDQYQNEIYYVEGHFFSIGADIDIYRDNSVIAHISNELFTFRPKYEVDIYGSGTLRLIKQFTLFKHEYEVLPLNWNVHGDFTGHEYQIDDIYGNVIATMSREWFTWGDSYCIECDDQYEIEALGIIICIDEINARASSASASSATH